MGNLFTKHRRQNAPEPLITNVDGGIRKWRYGVRHSVCHGPSLMKCESSPGEVASSEFHTGHLMDSALSQRLVPFNSTELDANIAVDYGLVVVMPLVYLVCYYYVNFQGFGVHQLVECNSICRLSITLLIYVGCFLYLTVHFLTILRRKSFYIEFGKRLKEIDALTADCVKLANGRNKLVMPEKKRLFYITWVLVLLAFGLSIFYDVKEAFKYYGPYCIVSNMVITFPYVAGSIVQGMFVSNVSIISERFRVLNILFDKINHQRDKNNSPIALLDIESDSKKNYNRDPAVISKFTQNKTENRQQRSIKSVDTSNTNDGDFAEGYDSAEDVHFSKAYDEARSSNG
ncbi:gustatory and pheromone receptor 33a-like, partial [Rhagoletis pomonella]|uniref:gustatory and pheromone receptor 33a-like n=1 Tax=Rhagoletis pomonella TaxID=28610 RepID=UPI0017843354